MRLSSREDIEAPIGHVFSSITDFDGFERQALRRGAEVERLDSLGKAGLGSEWNIRFDYRGKSRRLNARIAEFDAPNGYRVDSQAGTLEGDLVVELVALSPRQTRLQVKLEMRARNLTGRLLLQSLKFARNTITKRFSARVEQFAQDVQGKYTHA